MPLSRLLARPLNSTQTRRQAGFTLIELTISSALMALILASAYMCLHAGMEGRKLIEPRIELFQNARVVMAMMATDLRCACPLGTNAPFLGMHRMLGEVYADNLDFATHHYTPKNPPQGDYCEESIFVQKDRATGQYALWRRRHPAIGLDPLSGGAREELLRGILGLKFEYYDGFVWYDTWGDPENNGKAATSNRDQPNLVGMPEAVRITLLLDSDAKSAATAMTNSTTIGESPATHPIAFSTVARLNLAGASTRAAGGGSSGNDSSTGGQPGGQPTGIPMNGGVN